jgi:hypothetical protein
MDETLRRDEDGLLDQLTKHPGFKVLQKMSRDLEEMNLKQAYAQETLPEARLIKLGEISGYRKLLSYALQRGSEATRTQSWTETNKGVPAWQKT